MKMKKALVSLIAMVLMASFPVFSLAESNFGSSAVTTGQTYTLEQMLTYAIADEYMAQAEYAGILRTYGSDAPFSNIIKAEDTHITLLKTLFATYAIKLPENTDSSKATVPASLEEAYQTGAQAENANIAMYEAFLAQNDLPEDVRSAFTALKNASQSHLTAFSRNTQNNGLGQGMQNSRRNNGENRKMNGQNSENCPLGDDCVMNSNQDGRQSQMGGKGRHGRN